MKILNKNTAQSLIQYILLLTLTCMGIYVMYPYTIRAVNAHFKFWEDQVQDSYDDPLIQANSSDVVLPTICECEWKELSCNVSPCPGTHNMIQKVCSIVGCANSSTPPAPPANAVQCNTDNTQCCVPNDDCCINVKKDCGEQSCPPGTCIPGTVLRSGSNLPPVNGSCVIGERIYEDACGSNSEIQCIRDHNDFGVDGDEDCRKECLGQIPLHSTLCPGDDNRDVMPQDQMYTVVGVNQSSCTTGTMCEVYCSDPGYIPNPGKTACIVPICSEPPPSHQIATGTDKACAVLDTKNVYCWWQGGTATEYSGGNAIAVSGQTLHFCALLNTGNVHCWGDNTYGQAAGYTATPTTKAINVSAGVQHTCIVMENGNVKCWGNNNQGQSDPLNNGGIAYQGNNAVAVAAGFEHTCILKQDGSIQCWGANSYGESAPYNGADKAVGVTAGIGGLDSTPDGGITCAIFKSGNARCWGKDDGSGVTAPYNNQDAISITVATGYACIINKNQNIYCWGANPLGQSDPRENNDAVEISASKDYSCILLSSTNIICRGNSPGDYCCITPTRKAGYYDYKSFGIGALRTGTPDTIAFPVPPNNIGAPKLSVTGISGRIMKAFLFWHGVSTQATNIDSNASLTFAGVPIIGDYIDTDLDNCWGFRKGRSYFKDVTDIVKNHAGGPNGLYALTYYNGGNNGASLLIFYDDYNLINDKDVLIFYGNDSNDRNTDRWNVQLPNVSYSGGLATLELHVADGQSYRDGQLNFNGQRLSPEGSIFQGTTVPGINNGPLGNGNLWDIKKWVITSYLTIGIRNYSIAHFHKDDCTAMVVGALIFDNSNNPTQCTPKDPIPFIKGN